MNKKTTTPKFDTILYFNCIKKIMQEVRKNKIDYIRIYSEPRKNGYRTKLFGCNIDNLEKIRKIVKKLYPNTFDINKSPAKKCMGYYIPGAIVIVPKNVTTFISK